jgi:hypothetical protein
MPYLDKFGNFNAFDNEKTEHICKNCANRPKICKNKVGSEDSCNEFISFSESAEYQKYNIPK